MVHSWSQDIWIICSILQLCRVSVCRCVGSGIPGGGLTWSCSRGGTRTFCQDFRDFCSSTSSRQTCKEEEFCLDRWRGHRVQEAPRGPWDRILRGRLVLPSPHALLSGHPCRRLELPEYLKLQKWLKRQLCDVQQGQRWKGNIWKTHLPDQNPPQWFSSRKTVKISSWIRIFFSLGGLYC